MATDDVIFPRGNGNDDGELIPRKETPQPTKEKGPLND